MMKKPCGVFDQSYREDVALVRTPYRWAMLLLLVALLYLVVPLISSKYELDVFTNIAITAIAVLGLQVLIGFTGVVSIGHVAFLGLGAYGSAVRESVARKDFK